MTEKTVITDMDAMGARKAAELEKRCFSSPWEFEEYEKSRQREDFSCLCAYTDGEFSGFLMAFHVLDECHLLDIATEEKFRRQGVGAALIRELMKRAGEKDGSVIYLEVREKNQAARGLYEKLGFVPVGKRKDYYKYPTDDAVLYTLTLGEEKH
jgi:ribosomal-protein-alanine N-acetyltransferase